MRVWLTFTATIVLLACSSQESWAQGKGPRQGMMQGGSQGMMGGRMGQGMMGQGMGRMAMQPGMMGGGMGHGAMGRGMGPQPGMGQGMMGKGMGHMGPQGMMGGGMGHGAMGRGIGPQQMGQAAMGRGMMEQAKPNMNDPSAILAKKHALGLTDDQVERLEQMRTEGRHRAARVMTSEQKRTFHGLVNSPKGAKGPMN